MRQSSIGDDPPAPPPPPASARRTTTTSSNSGSSSLLRLQRTSTPSWSTYQTTPIPRLYAFNAQVLTAFDHAMHAKQYTEAYTLGMQFVETALLQLPKHGYYYSRRHERERMESSRSAVRVTRQLQDVLQVLQQQQQEESSHTIERAQRRKYISGRADVEETRQVAVNEEESRFAQQLEQTHQLQQQILNELADLALDQEQEASQAQYESRRAKAEAKWSLASCEPWLFLCSDFSLHEVFCPVKEQAAKMMEHDDKESSSKFVITNAEQESTSSRTRRRPEEPVLYGRPPSNRSSLLGSDSFNLQYEEPFYSLDKDDEVSLSAEDAKQMENKILLEKALFLSGWGVTASEDAVHTAEENAVHTAEEDAWLEVRHHPHHHHLRDDVAIRDKPPSIEEKQQTHVITAIPPLPLKSAPSLQFETLANCYHEDFDQMRSSGDIRISFANTYQGRIPGSTNGCTVIAPLLCIHHLLDDVVPDPGLPDSVIEQVIDEETPVILGQLREQLGLPAQAFLIPSDAHEYLITNGQLAQEQFLDVTGGNLLDDTHLLRFIRQLENPTQHRSSSVDGGASSMTNKIYRKVAACFFFHEHVVTILKLQRHDKNNKTCWYDVIDGLPLKQTLARVGQSTDSFTGLLSMTESETTLSEAFLPRTARIRCLSAEALTVFLRWYACSKFSHDNIKYIDQYAWNDNSCDFDPRVFQGFIWCSSLDQ
jgi:hypothetical protein